MNGTIPKKNPDGTVIGLDTVFEEMEYRAKQQDYPYLSDLLGSDWVAHLPVCSRTPVQYLIAAANVARRLYPDPTGARLEAELTEEM